MISVEQASSWMARALQLAALGSATTHPNPRVGCVIVQGDRIVGSGWHQRAGEAHAEVHALRVAGDRARSATMFVSLEPCSHHGRTPPCADAVIAAGISEIWIAMLDPNPLVAGRGVERLRAAGIQVHVGLMEAQACELNRSYIARMVRRRPLVTLKLAASLDGRTAMASGESQWITGAAARADVHRLRAEAGAVLTGIGTVLADDPALTAREPVAATRQPDRIVLDTNARAPQNAEVWADGARRYWLTCATPVAVPAGVTAAQVAAGADGRLDLAAALAALAKHEVNEVLVECGPTLAGALLQAGLVDELLAYVAPSLLGHDARPLAALPGLERLSQKLEFEWRDVRRVGNDLRLLLRPRIAA
ncbi:MAG: bifunctional diaminohydroxyphosphoribosylaminopyrimidine deaminase/5-amino-6-(5-phosphoribosylamino)uracil reductase RibD [Pseudomonadota bacterium]|nr:bifunctional diaminohydroxyphosphoribosylaminopyrimidine deaminase/5-amino-6-(5-phosphoribosylamino)uracil reductase RibD [Pseudomonadota bacterium]